MDARECIRLSVQDIVAEEFKEGAVINIATRLGKHVDLSSFVSVLCGIDTGLNFELLDRVNRWERNVGVEVRVGVVDAVERVVIEHNALPARGDRLRGAIATLARARLPSARRKCVYVR